MQNDAVVPFRSAVPAGGRGGPKAAWLPSWPQGDRPDVARGMLRRAGAQ